MQETVPQFSITKLLIARFSLSAHILINQTVGDFHIYIYYDQRIIQILSDQFQFSTKSLVEKSYQHPILQ